MSGSADWLVSHPLDVGSACWSPGDAWPEEPEAEVQRRLHRRRAAAKAPPPLLSLSFGPFSLPLVPRPRPLRWPEGDEISQNTAEAGAAAGLGSPGGQPASDGGGTVAPSAAAERLQALLLQRDPELTQRLAAAGDPSDAAFFARWLKARGGCVEAAAAGITAHAAWRQSFVGPAGAVPEQSIAEELAARKAFLQGLDSQGCPVVVVQAARHDMGRRQLVQTKRLIAYVLDSACATADLRRNPAGQICCLFDLSGLRPRNLDVKALLAIFELLQNHYPERLHSLYFLNAPFLFWGVWRCVSPFVHAATRQKIHFIGGAGGRRQLLQCVPAEVLPVQYGGAAELVPVEQAAAAWRLRQQQQQQEEEQAEAAAAAAAEGSGASAAAAGRALGARVAALQRRAGSAARAAGGLVSRRLLQPVGGAAAGAVRVLRRHRSDSSSQLDASLSEQQRRSLLAQVVFTHVLLVGLLLRMLQRVLGPMRRLPASGDAATARAGSAAGGSSSSTTSGGGEGVAFAAKARGATTAAAAAEPEGPLVSSSS